MWKFIDSITEYEKLPKEVEKITDSAFDLNGGYSAIYQEGNKKAYLRDLIGIVPIFYKNKELDPRQFIIAGIPKRRKFPSITPTLKVSYKKIKEQVKDLVLQAVKERMSPGLNGVLFSGGVDSTLIAYLIKKLGGKVVCINAGVHWQNASIPEDEIYARKIAKELKLNVCIETSTLQEVAKLVPKIKEIIKDDNFVKVSVGLPIYVGSRKAKELKCDTIFGGLGSEEIFAGYLRHKKSANIAKECRKGLLMMYERDTFRDFSITTHFKLKPRVPLLDMRLVKYALRIPVKYKLAKGLSKVVLRDVAIDLGLPKWMANRPKKAAQYGSKYDRALEVLAKRKGIKKSELVKQ